MLTGTGHQLLFCVFTSELSRLLDVIENFLEIGRTHSLKKKCSALYQKVKGTKGMIIECKEQRISYSIEKRLTPKCYIMCINKKAYLQI